MHQRNWLRAMALAPCLTWMLVGQDAAKPEAPAAGGVKVEAHRSKWDYPKEVTVGPHQKLRLVQTGDTLWDLAAKELGNPYSWPQIWELNSWIKDPHWIYPGDPLLIDSSRTVLAKGEEHDTAKGTAKVDGKDESKAETKDAPKTDTQDLPKADGAAQEATAEESHDGDLADPYVKELRPDRRVSIPHRDELSFTFSDFAQMPFLVPKGAASYYKDRGALSVVGAKNNLRTILGDGETIYLAGGADRGVKVGDRLMVMRTVVSGFFHPEDRRRKTAIGDIVKNLGVIRVTTVNPKNSIAVIERCFSPISVGDHAGTFTEPATLITKLRTDIADPISSANPAKVIYANESHDQSGQGELLILDKGAADGFKVGDVVLGIKLRSFPLNESKVAKEVVMDETSHYLGQLIVIHAGEHNATCRVLRSIEEIQIGDAVVK